MTKLQSGATGYDLVNPSQYAVQQLAGLELIQELDHSMLPSLGNVPESFQQAEYDPGNRVERADHVGHDGASPTTRSTSRRR